MRILVGKTFGLGNAVMSVPMVRALATIGTVDVLLGSLSEDLTAFPIFLELQRAGVIQGIYYINPPGRYDVAVMAIPFDGRWTNGLHYHADRVLDSRPRPGFSEHLGFSSWERHEVEYQIDNAIELGFRDPIPSMEFCQFQSVVPNPELVYLGLGFKRDHSGFWSQKHWGNDRYIEFIKACQSIRPSIKFRATGNAADLVDSILPISRRAGIDLGSVTAHLSSAFRVVAGCGSYFGNDTGMMHVAASMQRPTFGLMAYPNVSTKNRPWCDRWAVHDFSSGESDPVSVAEKFISFVWG